MRDQVISLVRERYRDVNDCHLAELLTEREAIGVSRQSLQRILCSAGLPAK